MMTSQGIAVHEGSALAEKIEWAKAMSSGTMLPRAYQGNPANLLFALEYADTLGIPRINALTSIHIIDGKPTASADLIASLVRKAGHKLRVTGDDTFAEAVVIRVDDPDFEYKARWDEEKARKAGRWGNRGPWTNYPGAMLRSRAITEVARMAASDALYGVIYTSEELGEIDDAGNPVHNVTSLPRARQVQPTQRPRTLTEAVTPTEPVHVDLESLIKAAQQETDPDRLVAMYQSIAQAPGEEAENARAIIVDLGTKARAAQQHPEPESAPVVDEPQVMSESEVAEALDAEIIEPVASGQ